MLSPPPSSPPSSCSYCSCGVGAGIGAFIGLAFTLPDNTVNMDDRLSTREKIILNFKDMKSKAVSYGKSFGLFGLIYSTLDCTVEKVSSFRVNSNHQEKAHLMRIDVDPRQEGLEERRVCWMWLWCSRGASRLVVCVDCVSFSTWGPMDSNAGGPASTAFGCVGAGALSLLIEYATVGLD